jgi:multiple sugar transport system substrate-binding protein
MKAKFVTVLVALTLVLGACAAPAAPAAVDPVDNQQSEAAEPAAAEPEAAEPEAAEPEAAEPAAEVSLRFSSWGDPEQNEPIQKILAAFKEKYPNVQIAEEYDPFDTYFEKKTTQIAGNTLPDVFALNTEAICDYAGSGRIADLTATLEDGTPTMEMLSGLSPSALSNLNIDGTQYAFPLAGNALVLYYNKDMFDAAGLAYPDPSWTFQDVLDAAEQLSIDTNGDGELDQWGYFPNYYNAEDFNSILHRFGARMFSQDGATAMTDTPEAIAAIKFIQDLSYEYKVTPRLQDSQGIENMFAAGLVAMYEDGAYFMGNARDITDFAWDVTSIPLGFEGQQGGGPLLGNPNFVVSTETQHPEEAQLLAAFLSSAEAQTILGEARGRMPAHSAGLELWSVTPPENIGVIGEVMSTNPDIIEPLCIPNSYEVGDLIGRTLEGEILTNNTPAAELMPQITEELQAIMDKQ